MGPDRPSDAAADEVGLTPPGHRLLVPGWSQWSWGQRPRGAVLFGSFASAALVSAFAWGTVLGLAVLGFAAVVHVVSTVDAFRQAAFPALGRWAPWLTATGFLAGCVYGPALALAAVVAWPGAQGGASIEGYLVDCRAFRTADPLQTDLVWFRPSDGGTSRLGRVVAGPGQEVEWADGRLRVDGREPPWVEGRPLLSGPPFRTAIAPRALAFRVPDGHLLVQPEGGAAERTVHEGLAIIDRTRVVGRAWAQFYPILDRRRLD